MGAYSEKQAYNATEEAFLKSQESNHIAKGAEPLKKAVGSEYFTEELDASNLTRLQF